MSQREETVLSPVDILVGVVIRPRETFEKLRETGRGYWGVMLAITAVGILLLAAAGAVAQSRMFQSIQASGSAVAMGQPAAVLQVIGALVTGTIGVLVGYLFRACVVFVSGLVMSGRANGFQQIFRMAVWTTLPLALRTVVQAIASFVSGGASTAGMSGVLSIGESFSMPTLSLLLSQFDIYLIWSVVLLGIGAAATSKLDRKKAIIVVVVYLVLALAATLALNAIGGAVGNLFGGGFGGPGMGTSHRVGG